MFKYLLVAVALSPATAMSAFDPSTAVPEGVTVVAPPPGPATEQQLTPQQQEQQRIIIDRDSGQRMSNGAGGFFDPRTGKFYPRVSGGYIDNETGRFIPAP